MAKSSRRGAVRPLALPWREWPLADQELWTHAVSNDDPFSDAGSARLSKATLDGRWHAWRRFLGFLAREELLALNIAPGERLTIERVRAFVSHLARTNGACSVANWIGGLYGAARMMMPERDWTWLKRASGRLNAAVPVSTASAPVITSVPVLELGLALMIENKPPENGKLTKSLAANYRNGLMLALLALIPLRARNFLALEIGRHLVRERDEWFIIIPRSETKTRTPIEFAIPKILNEYLELYLQVVRPWMQRGHATDVLWLSREAEGAICHSMLGLIVTRFSSERLGLRLSPHDLRDAAATTGAIAKPSQIAVSKDLLAHKDLRTTTRHYNRARGIEASRAQAGLIAELRKSRNRR